MAVYRVLDQLVVPQAEYHERKSEITTFFERCKKGLAAPDMLIANSALKSNVVSAAGAPVATHPIGKGLPLSILIREVFTGKYPSDSWFAQNDVAVVSTVKNYDVMNANARALNFVTQNVQSHSRLQRPSPFTDGTSLVAYSPAIMTNSLTIGFELGVANFPEEFMTSLSKAFGDVAQIPLLLPYSGYLMAAGEIIKLASNIGHALFDGIKYSVTDAINFDLEGAPPTQAGFYILAANEKFRGYSYSDATGLIDSNGNAYNGDTPYIVISLDGRERDNLKSFAPSVASAALLHRFFDVQSSGQAAIGTIIEGLQYVSDARYREQAEQYLAKMVPLPSSDPKREELSKLYKAAVANIVSEAMKPK